MGVLGGDGKEGRMMTAQVVCLVVMLIYLWGALILYLICSEVTTVVCA